MGTELRYPNITGSTEREMVAQMKSYLHQLVDQLQYALNNAGNTSVTCAPKNVAEQTSNSGDDVVTSDTGWISLGLLNGVSESSQNVGRNGSGCFYRVINGNHVYVAFNCVFQYANTSVTISGSKIPAPYRPSRNIYTLNLTSGRGIAIAFVDTTGDVRIDYVQNIASGENTASYSVNWIDGYIDYWV